jgi:diguanylate cyclase (GGDEF)-like protein
MNDGIARNGEIFLHHKEGHRVPVTVRAFPLRNAQGMVEGAVEIFNDNTYQSMMLERIAQFEKMAYLDALTGVANRRFTEMTLQSRLDERQRYGWSFGVLFIDVDHFKNVNDQHGHAVGDLVLTMVAKTLSNSVRSFDFVGRWGGEEFIAILSNVDAIELHTFANRLRALVEQSHLAGGTSDQPVRVTASIGATITRVEDTLTTLVQRADGHMYASKKAGRNCVTTDDSITNADCGIRNAK